MMDHRGQGHDLEQAKPHSAAKAPVSSRRDDTKFDLSQFPRQTISVSNQPLHRARAQSSPDQGSWWSLGNGLGS